MPRRFDRDVLGLIFIVLVACTDDASSGIDGDHRGVDAACGVVGTDSSTAPLDRLDAGVDASVDSDSGVDASVPTCAEDRRLEFRGGLYECTNGTVHRFSNKACAVDGDCTSDEDCRSDELCHCGREGSGNTCVPAGCRTNADCDGKLCVLSQDACGVHGYYCETEEDRCVAGAAETGCVYWESRKHWDRGGAIGCP